MEVPGKTGSLFRISNWKLCSFSFWTVIVKGKAQNYYSHFVAAKEASLGRKLMERVWLRKTWRWRQSCP